ncbi:hypothetical protein KCU64_g166, partial [Aureobasidium melanogenum]
MLSKSFISILALTSAVSASPSLRRETQNNDNCLAKTNACRTTRGPDGLSANQAQCSADDAACKGACYATLIKCQNTRGADGLSANQAACIGQYADCLGENPIASTGGIISSFIPYTATASSSAAAATTYACNPAHSYPDGQQCISTNGALSLVTPVSTKASSTTAATAATSSAASDCKSKDNICRTTRKDGLSANMAQCAADNAACQGACYAAYNTCRTTRGPDGLSANMAQCASEYASCLGENPIASTGGLISSFIPYSATASTMVTSTAKASSSAAAASSAAVSAAAPGSNPKKVDGVTWTLNNVIRYCGDNSNTCDYNFDIVANGKTEHCTIVDASKQSFSGQKCANGDYTVSWGYVANPAPAFAVITVVDAKNELAWFGASNVDSQRTWGNLGPEQVYTYN